MVLADLMDINPKSIFTDDVILEGDVIALDAKSGKKLFDTRINKREYINKFMGAEVVLAMAREMAMALVRSKAVAMEMAMAVNILYVAECI